MDLQTGAIVIISFVLAAIGRAVWETLFKKVVVYEYERGVLYTDGKLTAILEPGAKRIRPSTTTVMKVDMRPKYLVIAGQEVMTADSVSLKLSLAAQYKVVDPRAAVLNSENYYAALYTAIQLAAREIVGGTKIDELLENRGSFGPKVMETCVPVAAQLGLELMSANIRDIMFPGELKKVFTQVIKAQKEAQAALERARGESAALRSLANAAKLMEDNPTLLQLRALQALSENSGNTMLFGVPAMAPLPLLPAAKGKGRGATAESGD